MIEIYKSRRFHFLEEDHTNYLKSRFLPRKTEDQVSLLGPINAGMKFERDCLKNYFFIAWKPPRLVNFNRSGPNPWGRGQNKMAPLSLRLQFFVALFWSRLQHSWDYFNHGNNTRAIFTGPVLFSPRKIIPAFFSLVKKIPVLFSSAKMLPALFSPVQIEQVFFSP